MTKLQEMTKAKDSDIVLVQENTERIVFEKFGEDTILRDMVTGYECTIPKRFDEIRAACNSGQGRFVPMGKPSGTGDPNKFVLVDYREVRLNFGDNYRNHLFIEIYCIPVEGSLRKLTVNDDFKELGSGSLRLITFLISAETGGQIPDISKKKVSKTGELFRKTINSASQSNALLFSQLSPEEKLKIPNAHLWIQSQNDSSIFKRIMETSFVDEKGVVDGKEVKYFSMKFSSKQVNPENKLEVEAVLFADYIRNSFEKTGTLICSNEKYMGQDDYIATLRLSGFDVVDDPQVIEGELQEETKLLEPAEF